MPDITMCSGQDCPKKEQCYRHTAKPSDYQSYFMKPPIEDGKCDHYWMNLENEVRKLLKMKPNDIPNDTRDHESV